MNILMVSDIFIPPSADKIDEVLSSGAERVLFEECLKLSEMGNKVYLLSRRGSKEGEEKYHFNDIEVFSYYAKPSLTVEFLKNSFLMPRRIVSKILEEIDVINFHQPFSAFSINSFSVTKNIPSVYTCHSLGNEEYKTRKNTESTGITFTDRTFVIPLIKYMEKYNFRKSSLIRVLSRYTSERLKKFASIDDSKIKIIPGGVNEDRFCPVNNKQMLRKKFNLPAESIIFSTLRNMEPRMGLENLIKAIKKIKNHCTSSLFVIGGSGPLKSKLENMAHSEGLSDLIIFAGYIDENNLPDFYRMSNYFLLPTVEQEGFGLVTVEALASGVPVLGTPAGATPEILSKVDKKLIFSSTEVDSLAEGILQWIDIYKNKKEYYDEISKKGRRVVEEHYTWEKSAEKLLTIYKSIL